jgi:very-short-patch-repair endonuclease
MESRLRLRILDAGLPRPVCQHPVFDGPEPWPSFRLDLAWPASRVAAEYDGAHHLGSAKQRNDHRRHNRLRELGWRVFVFTAADVYHRADRIRALLAGALTTASSGKRCS